MGIQSWQYCQFCAFVKNPNKKISHDGSCDCSTENDSNCSSARRLILVPDFSALNMVSGNVLSAICPRDDQDATALAPIEPPTMPTMTTTEGLLQ